MTADTPLDIAILVYDGVEAADYVCPMTVFEKTNDYIEPKNTIRLISPDGATVVASNGTLVGPTLALGEAGDIDILVVPGGTGVIAAIADDRPVGFIRERYGDPRLRHILSVCSGAYLLAQAGMLDGKEATVTDRLKDDFRMRYPKVSVVDGSPVVADGGRVVTSGQIFMGIGAAYWLVEGLYGDKVLREVRERLGI
jgi:transcriptional regulator GlxA family with amidase domain